MSAFYDNLFRERVEPHLAAATGFPKAIAALEAIMPLLSTAAERSENYQWLGTVHQAVAARALAADDKDTAREHFALSEEFYLKGIDEDPSRLVVRFGLVRYYLSFGGDPRAAIELLDGHQPAPLATMSPADLALEHQRLALRAVALAFLGDLDRCARAFDAAFSEEILSRLESGWEFASLEYLAQQGLPFDERTVTGLVERLRRCGFRNEERLDILRRRLLRRES